LIDRYQRVAVDLGTGSGQAVLRRARLNSSELVVGIDADARTMAEASRRAASSPRRGGLPNALFLAAAAEELPGALACRADNVTIALPWGSLLRGLLTADVGLLASIIGMLRADGELEVLLSATDRDSATDSVILESEADAASFSAALDSEQLRVVECRPASESDVYRLSSAWGRRLGIPRHRRAWVFRARLRPDRVASRAHAP
jgi:16S rRNA (adenine(1408)-N(1))-methyltransferase